MKMKNFKSIKPNVMGGQKASPTTNSNSNWINESLSKPAAVNHDKRLFEAVGSVDGAHLGTNAGGVVGAEWTISILPEAITTQIRTGDASWETAREAATSTSHTNTTTTIESMHANSPHTISRFGMAFLVGAAGLRDSLHEIVSARIVCKPSTNSLVYGWTKQAAGATTYVSSGCHIVNGFVSNTHGIGGVALGDPSKYNDPFEHSPSMESAVTGKIALPGPTSSGDTANYWGYDANNAEYSMEFNADGIANLFSTGYDTSGFSVQYWIVTPQDYSDSRLEWDRHYSQFGPSEYGESPNSDKGSTRLEITYKVKNAPFEPLSRTNPQFIT